MRPNLAPACSIGLATVLVLPTPAMAHAGHLAGVAGHDHWVAGAAVGIAIALGLWAGLTGKRDDDAVPDGDDEDAPAGDEAEA